MRHDLCVLLAQLKTNSGGSSGMYCSNSTRAVSSSTTRSVRNCSPSTVSQNTPLYSISVVASKPSIRNFSMVLNSFGCSAFMRAIWPANISHVF